MCQCLLGWIEKSVCKWIHEISLLEIFLVYYTLIRTRALSIEVKPVIADLMKEHTNINVTSSDILIKLLETREEFCVNINEFRTNNLNAIENMNLGFEKLAVAIRNICFSSCQTNTVLLNKLDTLTSFIKNTNAIFNFGSWEIQNHNF